mgnify:CR=1 FL=1
MSAFNYRVVKDTDDLFRIIECYYDESKKIDGFILAPAIVGQTREELLAEVENILKAFHHPVLNQSDLP